MLRPAVLWTLSTLLVFLIAEALLFRTGWYLRYVEPASSAGQVAGHLAWLARKPADSLPEVLVLGDSRIGHAFSAPAATAPATANSTSGISVSPALCPATGTTCSATPTPIIAASPP